MKRNTKHESIFSEINKSFICFLLPRAEVQVPRCFHQQIQRISLNSSASRNHEDFCHFTSSMNVMMGFLDSNAASLYSSSPFIITASCEMEVSTSSCSHPMNSSEVGTSSFMHKYRYSSTFIGSVELLVHLLNQPCER